MSQTQNWRTEVNATDYFGNQKKRVEIEQRRPTIRQASDLVGPGIGVEAVRLDDYNNLLATFNGYYSSAPGALNAPNDAEAFIGQVVSDAEFGGRQTFTGLTSGTEYSRTFTRSPTDPETLGWSAWSGQRILPSAAGYDIILTSVPSGFATILEPPNLTTIGEGEIYESSLAGIRVRKQGVYTGVIQVGSSLGSAVATVTLQMPNGAATALTGKVNQQVGLVVNEPFTVWASDGEQGFSVSIRHTIGSPQDFWWRFQCTRLGDAV